MCRGYLTRISDSRLGVSSWGGIGVARLGAEFSIFEVSCWGWGKPEFSDLQVYVGGCPGPRWLRGLGVVSVFCLRREFGAEVPELGFRISYR